MEQNETPNNFNWNELYNLAEAEFILGPISQHGIDHWKAVEKNAIMLVEKCGGDIEVVRLFCYIS